MPNQTEYTVKYRNVKHPRLEFKTGTLLLILPKSYKSEKGVLEKYKKWIQKKELAIKTALEEAKTRSLNQERTDKELKNLVHMLAQTYQKELNTHISKIFFRKMKTKWASHSCNGNLTVNSLMKYLPQSLIEYIIYHEITHSIERKHNEKFWNTITKRFSDYPIRERELFTYWFLTQKKHVHRELDPMSGIASKNLKLLGERSDNNLRTLRQENSRRGDFST